MRVTGNNSTMAAANNTILHCGAAPRKRRKRSSTPRPASPAFSVGVPDYIRTIVQGPLGVTHDPTALATVALEQNFDTNRNVAVDPMSDQYLEHADRETILGSRICGECES